MLAHKYFFIPFIFMFFISQVSCAQNYYTAFQINKKLPLWEDSFVKSTKYELAIWLQSKNYVVAVLNEEMLSRNNDGSLDQEIDSNLKQETLS